LKNGSGDHLSVGFSIAAAHQLGMTVSAQEAPPMRQIMALFDEYQSKENAKPSHQEDVGD